MARTRVSEEEAKFDALITAGFSYKREDLPPLDGDLVQFTSFNKDLDKEVVKITEIEQEKEKFEYDLGLIVPLPTGGKLKFSGSLDEKNKLSPRSFEQHVSAMKFSLSQPLLRGAGVEANVAPIRIARLAAGKVAVKTKLAAIRVLAGAEKAYWKVYGARRMRDVQQQQFDLAAQNLEMVRRRVEEGLSAGIEVIRSELGVTQRLEDLILADTELRIQQRKLRMIMNDPSLPLESETFIVPTTEPRLIPFELSNDELAAAALENRMEMLELELSLAQDALKIDLARNKALPNFVLDFEYGILDRRSSFSRAWQEMWDFDNSQLSIGLRGEIPVTNIARRSQVQRAVLKRLQRLSSQELRALKIKQEVYNAVDALNRDWLRILAARQNVIVAGVNYDAEMNQFREGLRTMREVVEALTSLGKAQLKEIKAIVSYQIDQIDLAYATGTVLGYAQIDIEPLVLPEPYQPEHDLLVQPDWDE
ncbi:MAG: TolC family protein, partial [Phycisphaerae bacterium]